MNPMPSEEVHDLENHIYFHIDVGLADTSEIGSVTGRERLNTPNLD